MIIRMIHPEEYKRTNELFSIVFESGMDNTPTAQEMLARVREAPATREDAFFLERWAAFEDDGQTMMGFFIAQPFTVHFDGEHCGMVGIGGVCTLPQYRREGGIRGCFEQALPAMYNDGAAFSYLYPFSTAYYRKFGYGAGCQRVRWRLKLAALGHAPVQGHCRLMQPGQTLVQDVRQVYGVWQQRYNMMVVNEDYEYAWAATANPAKDRWYGYVYYGTDGTPLAYLSYQRQDTPEGGVMRCRRFVYTSPEGLLGLLDLAARFAADYQWLEFELPTDLDISPLLREHSGGAVQRELLYHGMARVLNVQKVLQMARYRGTGSIVLDIADPIIPANNQRFLLQFADGRAQAVQPTAKEADICLDIADFSALICGAYGPEDLPGQQRASQTNGEKLARVFYPKPYYITEYF